MKYPYVIAFAAAALATVLAAPCAHANLDAKCYNEWNAAFVATQIAQRCQFVDAAGAAQLKAAQDARMQCAVAHATAAEKGDFTAKTATVQAESAKRAATMDCSTATRQAFDAYLARLKKTPK